uniref:Superfamily I DNA and/or RNA helicase n=1 Tax=Candidatus Kentrum sp. DK TaxID=2126562 RepID=A0A450RTT9_9GAMM|nr:MAG: Superfamily I DNA and/or RNA helicase [Candidatus Kentron sp. DK]VFJ48108.1 MAG: Superfamily I DNA and/or RNA helicase [Candidatus Kentron sp. DK]
MKTAAEISRSDQFRLGGGVGHGQFYVPRDVDDWVFDLLSQGHHCYLFAPKQSGKSSLAFSLQWRLKETGIHSVYLDLSGQFGSDSKSAPDDKPSENDLCKQFVEGVGSAFGMRPRDSTGTHWPMLATEPAERLIRSVAERLAPPGAKHYIIFLDESDKIGAFLPESRALALAFAKLAEMPGGKRFPVTLCLLGSLPLASLGDWDERLPNLLKPKRIDDFTKEQIQIFLPAIEPVFTKCGPSEILDECFEQTDGHPYLTQLLLHQAITIGDKDRKRLSRDLEKFVRTDLLSKSHFTLDNAKKRILSPELSEGLALYEDLLANDIPADTSDSRQIALYLSGLAAFRGSNEDLKLCPRNSIFSDYFDEEWLEKARREISLPTTVPETYEAGEEIIDLVDRIFCQASGGESAPYERKNEGRVFLRDAFYEFRMANLSKRPFTLQLFKGLGGVGGELWHRVARTLTRISGHHHIALPEIEDGGYREEEDLAYIMTRAGNITLGESPRIIETLREDKREALIQFARLAEGLLKLHQNQLTHRNLHPGAINVVEKPDTGEWHLRLSRFEMSDLVGNLLRSLDTRRKEPFRIEEVEQLYAAQGLDDLVCLAPERLAWLFRSPGEDTLDDLYSDVFSLGMVVYQWFVGDLPPDGVRAVFSDNGYNPEAHRALLREMSGKIKETSLPETLKNLFNNMLSPFRRNRPTAFQVVDAIAKNLDAIENSWSDREKVDRFVVAYMQDEMVERFRDWGWISHGKGQAGEEELSRLLNEDLRHSMLMYSPQGCAPFERVADEKHRRARFVLMGNQFTYFCNIYKKGGRFGDDVPQVLLILFSHPASKTRRLEESRFKRHAPRIEIFPADADEVQSLDKIKEFSPWTDILNSIEQLSDQTQPRSGIASDAWHRDVAEALDWLLQLNRCRVETAVYSVETKQAEGYRYNLVHDDTRQATYLRGDALRNQLAKRRRPLMGDFSEDVAEQQNGRLMLLPDNHGQPDWNERGVEVRFIRKSAGDRIVIERINTHDIVPKLAWLQSPDDTGALWQLRRQRDAYHQFIGMPALVDQLGKPVSVVRLRNQWGDVASDLKGNAPEVIRRMLDSWPFFALHGPPGTGKTTVAARAIRLALDADRHQRVLVSAQSHYALDNLADRILKEFEDHGNKDVGVLRIASPTTVTKVGESMKEYLIDERTKRRIAEIVRHCEGWLKDDSKGGEWRERLRPIVKRWRDGVDGCAMEVFARLRRGSNLVFCTTGSANEDYLSDVTSEPFDWVIIEEAAKAWPTELAMPLTRGNRWTLIGDHKQLPAFGKDEVAALLTDLASVDPEETELHTHAQRRDAYLKVFDLFPGLFPEAEDGEASKSETPSATRWKSYKTRPVEGLTRQFRMRSAIANLVSEVFYDRKLETDPSADAREPPIALPDPLDKGALHWIDTGSPELGLALEKPRWHNPTEVTVVQGLLTKLTSDLPLGKKLRLADHLAILSPYLQQVRELKARVQGEFADCVHTVDAFQGREAEIVIVSMVRCNEASTQREKLGFLTKGERINVLFSRARYSLIIVGSLDHFERSVPYDEQTETRLWVDLCKGIRKHGTIHDAWDLDRIDAQGPQR